MAVRVFPLMVLNASRSIDERIIRINRFPRNYCFVMYGAFVRNDGAADKTVAP